MYILFNLSLQKSTCRLQVELRFTHTLYVGEFCQTEKNICSINSIVLLLATDNESLKTVIGNILAYWLVLC